MAQLGARLNGIEKVVGSSPTRSTGLIKELADVLALLVRTQKLKHKGHKETRRKIFFLE